MSIPKHSRPEFRTSRLFCVWIDLAPFIILSSVGEEKDVCYLVFRLASTTTARNRPCELVVFSEAVELFVVSCPSFRRRKLPVCDLCSSLSMLLMNYIHIKPRQLLTVCSWVCRLSLKLSTIFAFRTVD